MKRLNTLKLSLLFFVSCLLFSTITLFAQSSPPIFMNKWGKNGGDGSEGYGPNEFRTPVSIIINKQNYIYVLDAMNKRVQKFDADHKYVLEFKLPDYPGNMTIDGNENIYVTIAQKYSNPMYRGSKYSILKFNSSGKLIKEWSNNKNVGNKDGEFYKPAGIAVDSKGNVYVVDIGRGAHCVQKFDANGTFIEKWDTKGSGDGQFLTPYNIAVDNNDYVYVTDLGNSCVQKFDTNGKFVKKWGTLGKGNGEFRNPMGIIIDNQGNIYVTDTENHRIQKFDASGTYITEWGSLGKDDGEFNRPVGIAIDPQGDIYIVDVDNNRIQKFTPKLQKVLEGTWQEQGNPNNRFQIKGNQLTDLITNKTHTMQTYVDFGLSQADPAGTYISIDGGKTPWAKFMSKSKNKIEMASKPKDDPFLLPDMTYVPYAPIQQQGIPAPAPNPKPLPVQPQFTTKTAANSGFRHDRIRAIFANGQNLYVGTQDGLSLSTDGGNTFVHRTTADGLGSNTIYSLQATGNTIYAGTIGGLSISTDGGKTFINKTAADGLGTDLVNDIFVDGTTAYFATNGGGVCISTDGGNTFTCKTKKDGLAWDEVQKIRVVGSTWYVGTNAGLSISTDGGNTFVTRTTADGLADSFIRSIFVDGSTLYVGTNTTGLAVSTDGGKTFSTQSGVGYSQIYGIHVVGKQIYLATAGDGVYVSNDGGNSFSSHSNGLGHQLNRAMFADGNKLYVATDGGLSIVK